MKVYYYYYYYVYSNHSTKCRGDRSRYPLETRRKYAGPFAGIVALVYLTD